MILAWASPFKVLVSRSYSRSVFGLKNMRNLHKIGLYFDSNIIIYLFTWSCGSR